MWVFHQNQQGQGTSETFTFVQYFRKLHRMNAPIAQNAYRTSQQSQGEVMLHVMRRIFSLSTVVLLTLVETVENPLEPRNDAEVACGY